jgi:hypothetical protein
MSWLQICLLSERVLTLSEPSATNYSTEGRAITMKQNCFTGDIRTGDEPLAGTDGHVFVQFFGTNRPTHRFYLLNEPGKFFSGCARASRSEVSQPPSPTILAGLCAAV